MVVGSIPTCGSFLFGNFSSIEPVVKLSLIHQAVAQQVERHPDTVKVVGSSPACLTTKLVISSFKV